MTDTVEPNEKKSNGWGGARDGAGGARPGSGGKRLGAGRPRKLGPNAWDILGISKSAYYKRLQRASIQQQPPPPKQYAAKSGRSTPQGPVVSRMVGMPDGKRKPGIITTGSLSQFERAWVYVGVRKSDGLVKIGMSGNVAQRCAQLGISQFFAHPIVPGLAKTLESMALRRLGAMKCGSEWVCCKPEDAAAAVVAARTELSHLCHADPDEAPIEAYNRRRGMAA